MTCKKMINKFDPLHTISIGIRNFIDVYSVELYF
jgi:hypothetical protein